MRGNPCTVCGARVTNLNPKCTTCDPICTRAKRNGLTRPGQIKRDIKEEELAESFSFVARR